MAIVEKIKEAWYWWLMITIILFVSLNVLVNLIFPSLSRLIGPLGEDQWVWKFEYGGTNIYLPWLGIIILLVIITSVSFMTKYFKGRGDKVYSNKGYNNTRKSYKETLFSKWSTVLLSVITMILFIFYAYQMVKGPIGTDPVPNWFWLIMAVFLLAVTINFGRLTIKIDQEGILIGYGIFKKKISWDRVEDSYLDETSPIRYGGWGLRITRVDGKWRSVYNVVGGPRVVVLVNEGWIREYVFSTSNPEETMKTIERHLKKLNSGV